MIFAPTPKKIHVMLTAFRDGLQSVFGGKVRVKDVLPAMQAAAAMGVRHFEFGGGARYQAPYFYAGEDPFTCMDQMREAVGPDADLQILTRSVSGVTLTTQRLKALEMQARLMKKHGTTIDRNFDFMNDVDNLIKTGKPIVDAGMHHQVCVAMMGLPYRSDRVHTPDFYVGIIQRLLEAGLHFDSVCMKDASGTTDPHTCYETAKGLKKILPPEVPLSMHTHDTASMAVACYMAGIAGGVDRVDLSVRPMASGTSQPDVRSMWHALKGTGYTLDIDAGKMNELEKLLDEGLKDYSFNPVTTSADARVVNFPMPGGAIGPNVHMMAEAGILDRYGDVLAEFPEVVRAGGAWTSVTPGSQQYWLQAFNNVLHGRWQKDRRRLRALGARLLRPHAGAAGPHGDQGRRRAAQAGAVHRRSAGRSPGQHRHRRGGAARAQAAADRRERLSGCLRHRAGQEHGIERRHPAIDRQGQDQPAAENQGAACRRNRSDLGPGNPYTDRRRPRSSSGSRPCSRSGRSRGDPHSRPGGSRFSGSRSCFHRAGHHPMHGGRRRRDPDLPHYHRTSDGNESGEHGSRRHSRPYPRARRHGIPTASHRAAHAGLLAVRRQGRTGGHQRESGRHGA
jgi:pyruvate/oxaloacetate carboxyltransferase